MIPPSPREDVVAEGAVTQRWRQWGLTGTERHQQAKERDVFIIVSHDLGVPR